MHTEVRERVLPEGSVYAGVFVALDEGDYTLLAVDGHRPRDVTIRSGRVTEVGSGHGSERSGHGRLVRHPGVRTASYLHVGRLRS